MNILPKKRWHVRNRDNIARVRRDELAAQNEEKEKERRKRIAEQEAKLEILRTESKRNVESQSPTIPREEKSKRREHINFFEKIETAAANEEHEREIKEDKEKYEKQIGYLTYLGQNTNEAEGRVSWYNKPRKQLDHFVKDGDKKDEKSKSILDPLTRIESILHKKSSAADCAKVERSVEREKTIGLGISPEIKTKKKYDKKADLATLREKRLKRERAEQKRIEKLLSSVNGEKTTSLESEREKSATKFAQRYNSQFNPHLARQNFAE
ncbi:leukocyte receptor cluster member 1 homolog [Planococcus citri]|uniref:leukocyte receptor cluster member 1 homolog n=1 Tax=Planococcus citri TaxID=170843 RepID=UPI0031F97F30